MLRGTPDGGLGQTKQNPVPSIPAFPQNLFRCNQGRAADDQSDSISRERF